MSSSRPEGVVLVELSGSDTDCMLRQRLHRWGGVFRLWGGIRVRDHRAKPQITWGHRQDEENQHPGSPSTRRVEEVAAETFGHVLTSFCSLSWSRLIWPMIKPLPQVWRDFNLLHRERTESSALSSSSLWRKLIWFCTFKGQSCKSAFGARTKTGITSSSKHQLNKPL